MKKRHPESKHTKKTLMIVDVQQAFGVPPPLVEKIRRYGRGFHRRVFTQFVNLPGSLFRHSLGRQVCPPGSPDAELLIAPERNDLVLQKTGYGLDAAAIRRLRAAGIRQVTVCGIDTDACVIGVMFSLFDAGIVGRVREDLCWSSAGLHGAAMKIIKEQFPAPKRRPRAAKRRPRGRGAKTRPSKRRESPREKRSR